MMCALLGDVVVTSDAALDATVVDGGTFSVTRSLNASSWFMSPLHLLSYCLKWFNSNAGYRELTYTYDDDGVLTLTGWDGTLDFDVGDELNAALGLDSPIVGGTAPYVFPRAMALFWLPTWPLRSYSRAVRASSATTQRAMDSTIYSMQGEAQGLRRLSLNVARDDDDAELERLLSFWEERWLVGRSVTFYPNRADLPTDDNEHFRRGRADVLVCLEAIQLDLSRVVETQNLVSSTPEWEFAEKLGVPASEPDQAYRRT